MDLSVCSTNILPLDIWNLISLYLKPLDLAINKTLYNIYNNDIWYQNYLELLYPNIQLWKRTTYRDLYIKSLEMGIINKLSVDYGKFTSLKLPISAVCVYTISQIDSLFCLDFNGNLFLINKNNCIVPIDSHVISLSHYGYIKEYEAYYYTIGFNYNNFNYKKIPIIPISPFVKIEVLPRLSIRCIFCLTKDKLYISKVDSWAILDEKSFIIIDFDNAKDIVEYTGQIYILQSDGKLFKLGDNNDKIFITNDIKCFKGDAMLTFNNELKNIRDGTKIPLATKYYRNITLNNKKLTVKSDSIMSNFQEENVKNIFHSGFTCCYLTQN